MIGEFVRTIDNTTLNNTVHGMQIQAWSGTNVQGINTNANPNSTDYTHASNWFVGGASSNDFENLKVQFFTISIGLKNRLR